MDCVLTALRDRAPGLYSFQISDFQDYQPIFWIQILDGGHAEEANVVMDFNTVVTWGAYEIKASSYFDDCLSLGDAIEKSECVKQWHASCVPADVLACPG
jgi:hypothetical protein